MWRVRWMSSLASWPASGHVREVRVSGASGKGGGGIGKDAGQPRGSETDGHLPLSGSDGY